MELIWAPWRIGYIKGKKEKGCIFCRAKKNPQQNYVFLKGLYSMAMLNIYPYNNGHAMVFPLKHTDKLYLLDYKEVLDIFKLVNRSMKLLDRILKPQGYNLGINLSEIAGAGVKGHLHIHIVPRWKADTNFMPTVFSTKIISQSLDELYKTLLKNGKNSH